MFQYKAILRSDKRVISEGHDLEDVINGVKSFRRGEKHGEHTSSNVPVDVYHVKRKDKVSGDHQDVFLKTI
jgi:hypothetical protein